MLSVLGTVLTLVGYGVVLGIVVAGVVMEARVLNDARLAAAAVVLVGSAVLGVATLRARMVPWRCGALLIIAFPLGHFADQASTGTEGIVLALLWGSLGAALRRPSRLAEGSGQRTGETTRRR
jgi:hypothetical protein